MGERLIDIVRRPVRDEATTLLRANWQTLPPAMRTPQQMFGRQGNGCGATIGAMPRCDFACRGCYLNAGANRVPAESVDAIKAQMRVLRPILGHAGNLQLTDGEITLRPADEVIELIRYARSLDLIPMLMTHGDSFRRHPGLLERYMTEGGLVEVSIHIDTTQKGRVGDGYRYATREEELHPLRAEFAEIVREAQRKTGLPLRAVDGFLSRFGGISFRLDGGRQRAARMVGVMLHAPRFVASRALPYLTAWVRRAGNGRVLRGVRKLLTHETQLQPLVLVSHHFMSRDEIESDAGRERLAHCVFHVPMNGRLVSMCEVNAMGLREQYYGQLATASGVTGAGRP